jgi:hypothetical protein
MNSFKYELTPFATMWKKGQITLFILLGMLLVGFVALLYFGTGVDVGTSQKNPSETSVDLFVQSCIDEVLEGSIPYIAMQGGYYNPSLETRDYHSVPYYVYETENFAPSIEIVEDAFAEAMTVGLEVCIDGFSSFSHLEITDETPSFSLFINKEYITVDVNYLLTIKEGNTISTLSSFSATEETRFGTLFNIATNIAAEQTQHQNSIPLGFITQQARSNNIEYSLIYDVDNTVEVVLTDGEISFVFALRYDWKEVEI